jgi:hypothetical protein
LTPGRTSISREIGDVASKCRPGASDRRHAGEPQVGFCGTVNGRFLCKDLAGATRFVHTPSHGGEGCDGSRDELRDEKIAEVGWWDQKEGQLNNPEYEVARKFVRPDIKLDGEG